MFKKVHEIKIIKEKLFYNLINCEKVNKIHMYFHPQQLYC